MKMFPRSKTVSGSLFNLKLVWMAACRVSREEHDMTICHVNSVYSIHERGCDSTRSSCGLDGGSNNG